MFIHIFKENKEIEFIESVAQKLNVDLDVSDCTPKTETLKVEETVVKFIGTEHELKSNRDTIVTLLTGKYNIIFDIDSYFEYEKIVEKLMVDKEGNEILNKKGQKQYTHVKEKFLSYPKNKIIFTCCI